MDEELKNAAEETDGEVAAPADEEQDGGEFTGAKETEAAEPSPEPSGQEAPEAKPEPGPNEENAEKRRKREAKEREIRERIKQEAYRDAVIAATGGINPYTGEEIRDRLDAEEYVAMKEIERKGGDPLNDYRKTLKEREREKAKQAEAATKHASDLAGFYAAHPDVDVDKLFNDARFTKFAGKRLKHEDLSAVYTDYLDFTAEIDVKAEVKAKNALAKAKASPGSLTGDGEPLKRSYADMSDEEFEKVIAKAKRGELKRDA